MSGDTTESKYECICLDKIVTNIGRMIRDREIGLGIDESDMIGTLVDLMDYCAYFNLNLLDCLGFQNEYSEMWANAEGWKRDEMYFWSSALAENGMDSSFLIFLPQLLKKKEYLLAQAEVLPDPEDFEATVRSLCSNLLSVVILEDMVQDFLDFLPEITLPQDYIETYYCHFHHSLHVEYESSDSDDDSLPSAVSKESFYGYSTDGPAESAMGTKEISLRSGLLPFLDPDGEFISV